MAPPLCAVAAIGAARLWESRHAGRFAALRLPPAVAITALWQAYIVDFNVSSARLVDDFWFFAALLGAAFVAASGAIAFRSHSAARSVCCAAGIAVLAAMPGAWCLGISLGRVGAGYGTAFPARLFSGGPSEILGNQPSFRSFLGTDPKLIAFLEQNRGDAPYLLATGSAVPAAPIIIKTGMPVMVLGHFSGWSPTLTVEQFIRLLRAGQVKYALLGDGSGGLGHLFAGPPALSDWIRAHGRVVDPALWHSADARPDARPDERSAETLGVQLYDLTLGLTLGDFRVGADGGRLRPGKGMLVEGDALDDRMHLEAGDQPQRIDRAARQPGDQRLAGAIEPHLHDRSVACGDLDDCPRQHIERAQP
jgi:hypothetical protein